MTTTQEQIEAYYKFCRACGMTHEQALKAVNQRFQGWSKPAAEQEQRKLF